GSQIVFLIKIPLVTKLELTLFKIIPIPHPVDTDQTNNRTHSIILKQEYQYVGITKNRRQFTTFTGTELLHCTETEIFTICPEFQPIQHESKDQPYQLPRNCESGVIVISKDIFLKLKYANTWIYTAKSDTLTIACQGIKEPFIEKIKNQGLIKLNQECRAYAEHVTLNPTREIKTKYYINFISKIGAGSISFKINNSIKEIKIEKFKRKLDTQKLDNVHEMAHSLDEVEHMIDEEILRQSGVEIFHQSCFFLNYTTSYDFCTIVHP
ncbi:Envelope fusion protein, partial [Aphis craccivora]